MKYIGIDPGSSGGVAYIDTEKNKHAAIKMPVIKSVFDLNEFSKIMRRLLSTDHHHVVMEDVHSIFGMSAKSNFSFGKNVGNIEGVLASFSAKYTKVTPKVWQAEMWQGINIVKINTGKKTKSGNVKYKTDTKATSLLAAKRLFPEDDFLASERSSKPHDGIIDALLMAEYAKRKF